MFFTPFTLIYTYFLDPIRLLLTFTKTRNCTDMNRRANIRRKVLIITVVIATIGCTTFSLKDGAAVAQESTELFDPLSLPKRNLVPEGPWLDPISFNSEQSYIVRTRLGSPTRSITKIELQQASSLRDLIPEYPSNWITDYVSVQISTISNGKKLNASSANDVLSLEQISMLNSADLGASIDIIAVYRSKNAATDISENSTMTVSTTIVPETEASYVGGNEKMISYLKEKVLERLAKNSGWLKPPTVYFTINELGLTNDVELIDPSGNEEVDKILIEVIQDMPKWNPAANSEGLAVEQAFEFSVGQGGC